MTIKLFISYSSTDSLKVDAIVARMTSLKNDNGASRYTLWQDKYGILAGKDWWEAILEAIIDCKIFVFFISEKALESTVCRAELSYARERNRPVIPVVLEGEYSYNQQTGKADIAYWDKLPSELNETRTQLLFYEGSQFFSQFENVIAEFERSPRRWRNIDRPLPADPRTGNESAHHNIKIYAEARDYAIRLEFSTARKLFQKLINRNDADFYVEASEWIDLIGSYERLLEMDAQESTQYRVRPAWDNYKKSFPKHFITGIFDPKGFASRFDSITSDPAPPNDPDVVSPTFQSANPVLSPAPQPDQTMLDQTVGEDIVTLESPMEGPKGLDLDPVTSNLTLPNGDAAAPPENIDVESPTPQSNTNVPSLDQNTSGQPGSKIVGDPVVTLETPLIEVEETQSTAKKNKHQETEKKGTRISKSRAKRDASQNFGEYDVYTVISRYEAALKKEAWQDAQTILEEIKTNGGTVIIDIDAQAKKIEDAIQKEKDAEEKRLAEEAEQRRLEQEEKDRQERERLQRERDYNALLLRLWNALETFWQTYPEYDPDNLAQHKPDDRVFAEADLLLKKETDKEKVKPTPILNDNSKQAYIYALSAVLLIVFGLIVLYFINPGFRLGVNDVVNDVVNLTPTAVPSYGGLSNTQGSNVLSCKELDINGFCVRW